MIAKTHSRVATPSENRMIFDYASVKTYGTYLRRCPRPPFKAAICDLEATSLDWITVIPFWPRSVSREPAAPEAHEKDQKR